MATNALFQESVTKFEFGGFWFFCVCVCVCVVVVVVVVCLFLKELSSKEYPYKIRVPYLIQRHHILAVHIIMNISSKKT